MFKGILIIKDESGYNVAVQQIDDAVLPEGDALGRLADIGLIEIGGKQGRGIGQDIERRGLASKRVSHFGSPEATNVFILRFYVACAGSEPVLTRSFPSG